MNASSAVSTTTDSGSVRELFEPMMVLGHAVILLALKMFRRVA